VKPQMQGFDSPASAPPLYIVRSKVLAVGRRSFFGGLSMSLISSLLIIVGISGVLYSILSYMALQMVDYED